MTLAVWKPSASRAPPYLFHFSPWACWSIDPGTTVHHCAPTRFATSTASRIFFNTSSCFALLAVANTGSSKLAKATNTPIFMPRSLRVLPIFSCISGGCPGRPLSSQPVKPWSAANLIWSITSSPAWALNMPGCGA